MGIQVALNHRTSYRYEKAITLGPQVIQLRPAFHCRTPILSYSLAVTPASHVLNWQLDPHNNRVARVLFQGKTNEFVVDVNLVADLSPINPFDFFLEPGVAEYPFAYAPALADDLEPYRRTEPRSALLHAFLEGFAGSKSGTVALLLDLNRKVMNEVGYVTRMEPGVQTCEETLQRRSGSCRDSAWLLVQCLRNLGIAETLPPEVIEMIKDEVSRYAYLFQGGAYDRLDLAQNMLFHFDSEFKKLTRLRYLDIRSNKFREFPDVVSSCR